MATILHVAVIGTIQLPRSAAFTPPSVLEIRLASTEPWKMNIKIRSSNKDLGKGTNETLSNKTQHANFIIHPPKHLGFDDSHTLDDARNVVSATPDHPVKPPDSALSPPRLSMESLRDLARSTAREVARDIPSLKEDGARIEDRPMLPELARALARKQGGKTVRMEVFTDGLMKIVTPSGSVYCLRPPPVNATGGPVEPLSVPTNCP